MQGLDDEGMINEILREVSLLEDINDTNSEWVLLWAQRVEGPERKKEKNNTTSKRPRSLTQSEKVQKKVTT